MRMNRKQVADLIEAFLNGSIGDWDWDDFVSVKQPDPEMEKIRAQRASLPDDFPPTEEGHYCGPDGLKALQDIAVRLRV